MSLKENIPTAPSASGATAEGDSIDIPKVSESEPPALSMTRPYDAKDERSESAALTPLIPRGFHFYEGDLKWLAKGVTYGPFAPNGYGDPFPERSQIRDDFQAISATGGNAVRTYAVPGEEVAESAEEAGLRLLIDIPWPKHLDVYRDRELQQMCLEMTKEGVRRIKNWSNVAGILLGNEISSDLVRWAGPRSVESFLSKLCEAAREIVPETPIGYANFPGTEFLQPRFFDFLGFNIYLHDSETFRNYLIRLRHMYPETPLVLSEIGMDTQSQSEEEQSDFLKQSLSLAYEAGMAGAYVFSWTDEWHTGGYDIHEWSFGLVDHDRNPKLSLTSVETVFRRVPQCALLKSVPRVSVVVATYNGASTLRGCLNSLEELDYPDYEIIVVDDGSTDDTQAILKEFQGITVITQSNNGLSAARNAGIEAAGGGIVAFTDSDCVVDPDWLYHLACEFEKGDLVGVGGPNLTPEEDGFIAGLISLAPGHATHVLLAQDNAEHIPGCNMAFRRDALVEAGGFDPVFRKAGDDVDMAWRLQDMGHRIGFSTSAFVWHHRRPTIKGYLRQQVGYGEAEAFLSRKHPHRFNDRGQSIWGGVIYAGANHSALLAKPNVNYGIFGSAGFQCVYEKRGSGLAYLLTSLEWWLVCIALTLGGILARPALVLGLTGLGVSLSISGIWARQKWRETRSFRARGLPIVWLLWVLQPLLREGARQWFRYRSGKQSKAFKATSRKLEPRFKPNFVPTRVHGYWSEEGSDRLHLLQGLARVMTDLAWSYTPNTPWEPWDFSIRVSNWFKVRVTSAEENHGGMKRLLKLRFKMLPTSSQVILTLAGLLLCLAVGFQNTLWARWIFIGWLLLEWFVYRRGCHGRSLVESVFDGEVRRHGFEPMEDLVQEDGVRTSDETKKMVDADGEYESEENLKNASKQ